MVRRRPDDELRQVGFAAVLLLANRMQATYDAALGDLTLKQWLALVVANAQPQPIPSTAVLTQALGTSHQNVTKLLDALARKGYMTLTPSPDDGRARQVTVTDAARDFLHEHERTGERLLTELFAGVDRTDLAACVRVLEAMSQNLTGSSVMPPREVG